MEGTVVIANRKASPVKIEETVKSKQMEYTSMSIDVSASVGTIIKPTEKETILTDTKTKAKYQVISSDNNNPTVAIKNSTDKRTKTIRIPRTVTIKGITYQVVSVSNNACKNHKKVTKIIVGSNVKKIGKYAFSDCRSKEQTEKLYKIVPKERSE